MITKIEKVKTRLAIIHNIPKKFFKELENASSFGNHLFPSWIDTVFSETTLKNKFEAVYNAYKAITNKPERDLIIDAFTHTNKIEDLCNNNSGLRMIVLDDLNSNIHNSLDELFLYLYDTAINYHKFQSYAKIDASKDTLHKTISRFTKKNKIVVCPFCGLESFINIEGQARLPLDHWLSKDIFPMSSVNLNNLVPIGNDCNGRAVKSNKNVLIDENTNLRIKAFYPYNNHQGISVKFTFINEPTSKYISDTDWELDISPNNIKDIDIFNSWKNIMNIEKRYKDYFRQNIFTMWETDYREYVEDKDNDLKHATTIDELRNNLRNWKSTFKVKGRPGSLLFRAFIDYLINNASNAYLTGISLNFNSNFHKRHRLPFSFNLFGLQI